MPTVTAHGDGLWLLLGAGALVVLAAVSAALRRLVQRLHAQVYGGPAA